MEVLQWLPIKRQVNVSYNNRELVMEQVYINGIIVRKQTLKEIREIVSRITVWKYWDHKAKQFFYSHYSNGWTDTDKPEPYKDNESITYKDQAKMWKGIKWKATHAHLIDNNVVYEYKG